MAPTLRQLITEVLFKTDKGSLEVVEKSGKRIKRNMSAATREVRRLRKELRGITLDVRDFLIAIATHKITRLVTGGIAEEVAEWKRRGEYLGETVQSMQELSAAAKHAEVPLEDLADIMKTSAVKANDAWGAAGGSKDVQGIWKGLGLGKEDLYEANGQLKTSRERLMAIADAYRNMKDRSKAAALLDDLFGDVAGRAAKLLAMGRKGIEQLIKEMRARGVLLDDATIAQAQKYGQAMKDVKVSLLAVRNAIAADVLPTVAQMLSGFAAWLRQGENMQMVLSGIKVAAAGAAVALAGIATARIYGAITGLGGAVLRLFAWLELVGTAALLNAKIYLLHFRLALAKLLVPGKALIAMLRKLRAWILAVGAASGISAKSILFFKGVLSAAGGAARAFVRILKLVALTLIRVGRAAIFAGGKIFLIVASIAFLALLIEDLVRFAQGHGSVFGDMFGGTAYGEAVRDVLSAIAAEARAIGREFAPLGAAIAGAFRSLFKALNVDLAGVVKFLGTVLKAVLYIVLYMVLYILKAITWLVRTIKAIPGAIGDAWDWIADKANSAAESVKDAWRGVLSFFAGMILKMKSWWDWLGDRIKEVGDKIASIFKRAYQQMSTLWDKTKGFLFGGEVNTKWVTAQARALKERVQQNNTVQSPTVNVHISGSANMSPEEVTRRAKEGTTQGWREILESEFGDWGKVTP